jgi:hypothetical protein
VWLKLGGSFWPRRAGASSGIRNGTAHGPASVGGADAAERSDVNDGLRKPSGLADRGVSASPGSGDVLSAKKTCRCATSLLYEQQVKAYG